MTSAYGRPQPALVAGQAQTPPLPCSPLRGIWNMNLSSAMPKFRTALAVSRASGKYCPLAAHLPRQAHQPLTGRVPQGTYMNAKYVQ